ncbi:hypothetical protein [Streptacidiphilus fuscans]|uniref:Uncharacterized protein n=1 Tax=Streptacidiphilus fuscans TaxID=2789292 RepID=A0A931B5G9_9ACTN|nr:hypothetical protein [Streptacidiphilus fuscans]MBF9069361.1 hypothetical protein [Streptacidiphilus fuscans]
MSKVKNQPRKQKSGQQKPVASAHGAHAPQAVQDRQMQDRQHHGKAAMMDDKAHAGEPMMMSPMPEGGMRMPSHKKEKRLGHN